MKKKSFLQRWLQNGYVMFVIAVIISLTIWVYMSINTSSNETSVTISDIPIQIELSDEARELGLQVFTPGDPKASVTVSGNRTVLGLINENDFTVTASAASINTPGDYTIPVSANKRSTMVNYQITSSSPSTISVTVDYFKESEFPIQDGIVFYVEDGYYGAASLPYNSISVSGPQSEVLKIKKVVAKANIESKLKESQDVDASIVLLDENDNEISQTLLNLSFEKVKATVTVLPEKTVAIEPVFVNKPEGLTITDKMISISPSEILLAGPDSELKKIESVKLEPIDFSTIKNEKVTFDELGIEIPENCKSISNDSSAKVVLDLSVFSAKNYTVENFSVEGLSDEYEYEVTSKSIDVTVIGSKSDLEKLTSSQITAVIDTSAASGKTGSVEMPVTFKFSNVTSCWAYGTYQANVTISKK